MDPNKITAENSASWLASCGFLFPTNDMEMERFNLLYGNIDISLSGREVDPFKIIQRNRRNIDLSPRAKSANSRKYKMVARRNIDLPERIINKLKDDQSKKDTQ